MPVRATIYIDLNRRPTVALWGVFLTPLLKRSVHQLRQFHNLLWLSVDRWSVLPLGQLNTSARPVYVTTDLLWPFDLLGLLEDLFRVRELERFSLPSNVLCSIRSSSISNSPSSSAFSRIVSFLKFFENSGSEDTAAGSQQGTTHCAPS